MRTAVLTLLLCVPLAAKNDSWLAAAVERLGCERAAERDAATRAIRNHVRRELAPLLAALDSDDPETARRARAVLRTLLPPPFPPDELIRRGLVLELGVLLGDGVLCQDYQNWQDALRELQIAIGDCMRKDVARRQTQLQRRADDLIRLGRAGDLGPLLGSPADCRAFQARQDALRELQEVLAQQVHEDLARRKARVREDRELLAALRRSDAHPRVFEFGLIGRAGEVHWGGGCAADGFRVLHVVPGSPAERRGLKAGDGILTIQGESVEDADSVHEVLGTFRPWTVLRMFVVRGRSVIQLKPQR